MLHRRSFLVATPAAMLAAPALAQTTAQPGTQTMAQPGNVRNIADTLAGMGGYTEFLGLMQRAGVVEVLRGAGPFILLAPNDAALGRVPRLFLDGLAPTGEQRSANAERLRAFINSHIIENRATMASLMGRTTPLTTRNGNVVVVEAMPGQPVRIQETMVGGMGAGGINIEPRDRVVEGAEVVASNGVIWPVSLPVIV